jgi:hypothetical protein
MEHFLYFVKFCLSMKFPCCGWRRELLLNYKAEGSMPAKDAFKIETVHCPRGI